MGRTTTLGRPLGGIIHPTPPPAKKSTAKYFETKLPFLFMELRARDTEHITTEEKERADLLQAIAEGLADDAAGRTMTTAELKQSLADKLGPIQWP